jgi:hypothetical protein
VQATRDLDEDTLARRRVLGEDYSDTLESANNLAIDLRWAKRTASRDAIHRPR